MLSSSPAYSSTWPRSACAATVASRNFSPPNKRFGHVTHRDNFESTVLWPRQRFEQAEGQVGRSRWPPEGCRRQLGGQSLPCVPLEALLPGDEGFGRKYGSLKFGELQDYTGIDEHRTERIEDWCRVRDRNRCGTGWKVRIMSMWSFFGAETGFGSCLSKIY
ncbi:hypothetical protein HG536_0A05690 [Torulaspora globosa]|uniref:Uncharacterized protein n=1 Tax=Torulaspora globosa TaxID=48254 RepID=A0A7G3ZB68_9SACH|nr:uncharacterized protein HG536_0A05690 [Torulaspora globosa]QLL30754.1 hypothetical protein HG536_0A05690 [Torulaspora globosa]